MLIDITVFKSQNLVVELAPKHTDVINNQRDNFLRLVNDKLIFEDIKRFIKHKPFNLFLPE